MDIIAGLKKVFPKPNIPQKRYLIILGMGLYWALKVYTAATPSTSDDKWPDLLKGAAIEFYSESGEDGWQFGEGA